MIEIVGNIIQYVGCFYTFFKCFLRKHITVEAKHNLMESNILMSIITWILSAATIILTSIIYVILGSFKVLVGISLRLHYGRNYGGFLRHTDNLYVTEEKTSGAIVVLLIVTFDSSKGVRFADYAKKMCENHFLKKERLISVRKTFLGCQYLVNNQVTIDDMFTSTKFSKTDVCDQTTLCQVVQNYFNRPFPIDGTGSFEVIAGEESLKLDNSNTKDQQYPILIRAHHSVCDGATLLCYMQDISDEGIPTIEKSRQYSNKVTWKMILMKACNWRSYIIPVLSEIDKNDLKVGKLSGDKKVAFMIDSSKVYVEKVKKIKNSIPNCAFSDVLIAALSAGLYNYYKKYCQEIPEDITVLIPVIPDRRVLLEAHKNLRNVFTVCTIRAPIKIHQSDGNTDAVKRLLNTSKQCNTFRNSNDVWMSKWLSKTIADVFPAPLLKMMVPANDISTAMLSSIPGVKKVHIDGCEIKSLIAFPPTICTMGLVLGSITYDDKFQITLTADSSIIPEQYKVQHVLDWALKYLDDLYEEMLN